jgi:hypothetical protein
MKLIGSHDQDMDREAHRAGDEVDPSFQPGSGTNDCGD